MINKTKNQIIEELYREGFIDKYISKLALSIDMKLIDDIRSEIYLQICSIKEEKILSLYKSGGLNKCRAFISGLIYRQIKSKNSAVYKLKKQYLTNVCVDDFVAFYGDNKGDNDDE